MVSDFKKELGDTDEHGTIVYFKPDPEIFDEVRI